MTPTWGTEVLVPLKEIYESRIPEGYRREIILLTDGQIGNEFEVMEIVKKGDQGSRLFTVGIGYGPNEYFIRQLTRAAKGTSELVSPGERVEPKILRLFKQVMSERMDDLRIDWGSENLQAEQAPFKPVLFTREAMSIFTRVKENLKAPGEIPVSFGAGKNRKECSIPIQEVKGEGTPVHLLWARERIRDLEEKTGEGFEKGSRQMERKEMLEKQIRNEIIRISRDFGILSKETSFVAVETRTADEKTKGDVLLRKVPVMLTKGWGGVKFAAKSSVPAGRGAMYDSMASSYDLDSCTDERIPLYKRIGRVLH